MKRLRRGRCSAFLAFTTVLALFITRASATANISASPAGFSSNDVTVNGARVHYVRGGRGPALVLLHGFPEDWTEYHEVLPRLGQRFTVVAIDLPGIGKSAPATGGYTTQNLASEIHAAVMALRLDRPYIVGHDLGGLVTYAYVRRFPGALRGAMILDVPMPGVTEAPTGFWHIGFIQAPKELAEKLVVGRQAAFLGWFYDLGNFTKEQRAYYVQAYGASQLHAAFEIYRALPQSAQWNAAQTSTNSVPLVIGVGEKSFFAPLVDKFVQAYRAKGMSNVESVRIPHSGHYVLNDNPAAVADLIERFGTSNQR